MWSSANVGRVRRQVVDARAAGAAEVEQQRADALVRAPVDSLRISAMPMVSPSGFDQSSGTLSVAHRQSLPGAEPRLAVALQRPQSSFCEVSEEGRRGGPVESEGAAAGGLPSSLLVLVVTGRAAAAAGHQQRGGGQRPSTVRNAP